MIDGRASTFAPMTFKAKNVFFAALIFSVFALPGILASRSGDEPPKAAGGKKRKRSLKDSSRGRDDYDDESSTSQYVPRGEDFAGDSSGGMAILRGNPKYATYVTAQAMLKAFDGSTAKEARVAKKIEAVFNMAQTHTIDTVTKIISQVDDVDVIDLQGPSSPSSLSSSSNVTTTTATGSGASNNNMGSNAARNPVASSGRDLDTLARLALVNLLPSPKNSGKTNQQPSTPGKAPQPKALVSLPVAFPPASPRPTDFPTSIGHPLMPYNQQPSAQGAGRGLYPLIPQPLSSQGVPVFFNFGHLQGTAVANGTSSYPSVNSMIQGRGPSGSDPALLTNQVPATQYYQQLPYQQSSQPQKQATSSQPQNHAKGTGTGTSTKVDDVTSTDYWNL